MVVRLHLVVGIFNQHEQQWPRFDTQLITVKEQNGSRDGEWRSEGLNLPSTLNTC